MEPSPISKVTEYGTQLYYLAAGEKKEIFFLLLDLREDGAGLRSIVSYVTRFNGTRIASGLWRFDAPEGSFSDHAKNIAKLFGDDSSGPHNLSDRYLLVGGGKAVAGQRYKEEREPTPEDIRRYSEISKQKANS